MRKPITVLDLAVHMGAKQDEDGGISGAEFERLGLPMLGGCACCGACVGAYNACPSTSGYLKCANGCIGNTGYYSCDEARRDIFGPTMNERMEDAGLLLCVPDSYWYRRFQCVPELNPDSVTWIEWRLYPNQLRLEEHLLRFNNAGENTSDFENGVWECADIDPVIGLLENRREYWRLMEVCK